MRSAWWPSRAEKTGIFDNLSHCGTSRAEKTGKNQVTTFLKINRRVHYLSIIYIVLSSIGFTFSRLCTRRPSLDSFICFSLSFQGLCHFINNKFINNIPSPSVCMHYWIKWPLIIHELHSHLLGLGIYCWYWFSCSDIICWFLTSLNDEVYIGWEHMYMLCYVHITLSRFRGR